MSDEYFREQQEFEYYRRQCAKSKLQELSGNKKKITENEIDNIKLSDEEIEDIINEDIEEYER